MAFAKKRVIATAAVALFTSVSLALTACSGGGSTPTNDPTACGSVPNLGANDPNKLLPEGVVAQYNGYPNEIQASSWADWTSSKTEGFTAAVLSPPPSNPYIAELFNGLRDELKAQGVEIVADYAVADFTDVPGQIAQFEQALALKPDVIYISPLAPEPFVDEVAKATEAGIPVVSAESPIDAPGAIGVVRNNVIQAMDAAATIVNSIGQKGNLLKVIGIPGLAADTLAWIGTDAVLAQCPDVKIAGEVTGNFVPASAQAETLKYLTANPAGVDGVVQAGTMGAAILQAFQDAGADVVPISDIGASMGFVNYAADNPKYPYIGSTTPAAYMGQLNAQIGLRVLLGEGPKVNILLGYNEMIDAQDAAALADPAANPYAFVVGDPAVATFPDGSLDLLFNNPGLLK